MGSLFIMAKLRHIAYIKLMIRNRDKAKQTKESFPLMLKVEILYDSHHNLKSQTPLSKHSKNLPLAPMLVNTLIKVGGRIQHSNIPDQQKHQTILLAVHHITSFIVTHLHENIIIVVVTKL